MSPFLKHIKMESFGAFSGKVVGPFGPHLNVVFGPNEAGKTTTASFVRGVLFGWEEARGVRNTYKPQAADRAGSLFFDDGEGGEIELFRGRNAEGLKGDASLVHDIDRETFSTMFSLTATSCAACATPPTSRRACSQRGRVRGHPPRTRFPWCRGALPPARRAPQAPRNRL